jgi:hypothetical protein
VSWLLVAFIPGLLMLATFGLDRLEASLIDDESLDDGVAELIEQAKVDPVRRPTAVPDHGPSETLPHRELRYSGHPDSGPDTGLPTRVYVHAASNPQFRPTRQADRV